MRHAQKGETAVISGLTTIPTPSSAGDSCKRAKFSYQPQSRQARDEKAMFPKLVTLVKLRRLIMPVAPVTLSAAPVRPD